MKTETVAQSSTGSNAVGARTVVERLAVFAPNWLGDAVMALPAVADVRRALPRTRIAVVARAAVASMFTLVPDIDEVVEIGRPPTGLTSGLRALRERRLHAALLLPNSFNTAAVAWRAGIPERWGYKSDWRGLLLTRAVERPHHLHQADYYQHLVASLGFANGPQRPQLVVPSGVRDAARRRLEASGWKGGTPLVAVAPGAAYGGAKRWPAASFAALVAALDEFGVTAVFVGSPGDRAAADDVKRGGPARSLDLVGDTDLPTLAGVLVHCRALVTNDSGAMHVAAALEVPIVALFGPTNERETHPVGGGCTTVLTHDVWCRPCMLRECPIDHRCMRGITVDAVLEATRQYAL